MSDPVPCHTPKRHSFAMSLVAACALAACGSIPPDKKYERPALDVPSTISPGMAGAGTAASGTGTDWLAWWRAFQDPVLDALLLEAASNSQDLALATARIAEARATLDQNRSNLYPSVDLNASVNRRRSSENSGTLPRCGCVLGRRPVRVERQLRVRLLGQIHPSR